MEVSDIINAITTLFNFPVLEETEDQVTFQTISDKTAILDKNHLRAILTEAEPLVSLQGIELMGPTTYEVLVRLENRYVGPSDIHQVDTVNKIEYRISKPTTPYLVHFLYYLDKQNTPRILRRTMMAHKLRRIYSSSGQLSIFSENILDLMKEILPQFDTIQIKSDSPKKQSEFEQLVYSLLFNLGYNLDYTILPLRFMEEFTQSYRIGRLRRSKISEVEAPKRVYTNELILHYQKGISSESLDHQFLSFYHVLEHFFEKIYTDDIISSVKTELTKPSFSYKRTKDINSLVSIIQTRLKYKNDEFSLNELEALELTLKNFITDISSLSDQLNEISATLLDYFKRNEVPFSKGNRVNFESENLNEIFKNLSKRIYLTRNAIVHSKETGKIKYTPFRDDKDLTTEIYLLRLIAEMVIIADSKEL